jgi:hypothetical protein
MGQCGLVCPKGFADCNHDPSDGCETVLGTDANCGFCQDTCALPHATSHCQVMGGTPVCNLLGCADGWANCDMVAVNGCEANTNTDANNCNACGNHCASGAHSTPVCASGVCRIVCDPGYADCDGDASNGCEVHTDGDTANCGTCHHACSSNHATESCVAGLCQVVTCLSGWNDCNKDPSDGCEDNTLADPLDCGSCGNICKTQNGTPSCSQGTCGVGSCNQGFAHCPGQPGTNCETSTNTDVNNCGSCGKVCGSNHASPSCQGGTCVLICAPGFGDCDHDPTNGCETPLTTVGNCGACGAVCTTQNGTPACNTATTPATCGVGACSMGYAACPGNGNNCLTFIGGTDVNNCGGCGVRCATQNGTPACNAGVCAVGSCSPGWGHCSPGGTDCSTPLNTVGNCGSCGHTCTTQNGTPACNSVGGLWTCQAGPCNSGFANCPGNGADCSTNTNTDNNNCGGCGSTCTANTCGGAGQHVATAACSGGSCGIVACLGNWQDTDLSCADGCECALSTVPSTCPTGAFSLGSIPLGGGQVFHSSNLFPASPNAAYYVVSFTGNTSLSYFPRITLSDPLNEFVMDVTSDCFTQLSNCTTPGDSPSTQGITIWDASYNGPSPEADPNSKAADGTSNFGPIPVGTVYIKVYRKGGVTSCNNAYTIAASG